MTREEIIDGLEIYTAGRLNKDRVHITVKELQKFIDAIKALEQEPCEDAISLEAVIEWLKSKDIIKLSSQADTARKELKTLSSGKLQPSGDAISRQRVLDINFKRIILTTAKPAEMIEQEVKALPSVTPKPKAGHWITTRTFMHDGEFYCDKCKCDSPNNEKWDYCPNCGCVMKGELE